ncbi:phosphoenolpyruvate--protein phosphotransferase [Propionivibrio soli]|uniref:phosphoenolpyruvate--protein phosphotransferase n=1 Tax=Propionivibrio soli TaxID=2976531 RepID=UPI0021E8197F|nr:phosphoenolpyruvate--protein phosphotransferase [Propionivibrio soli]
MTLSQQTLSAFATGTVVSLGSVPDPVFAGGMMGDGVAVDPTEGRLCAPCAGRVVQLHASRHACILETDDGMRVLLHVGIDTVLLKGAGFSTRVAQGDLVYAGQPLIEFDIAELARQGKPSITILTVENGDAFAITWRTDRSTVAVGAPLLAVSTKADAEAGEAGQASDASSLTAADAETAKGWAIVRHPGGLHARPCAALAASVKPFAAVVEIEARSRRANARSVTAVMGLAVDEGEEVQVVAVGEGAGDALEAAVVALETPLPAEMPMPASIVAPVAASVALNGHQLAGVAAAPGLAIGATARFGHAVAAIREQGEGEILERRALAAALQAVAGEIEAAVAEAARRGLAEQAGIFAAHRTLVEDPELFAYAAGLIAAGKSAAFAWRAAVEAQCSTLQATGNALLAGRAADLRDVERQVLRKLAGEEAEALSLPPDSIVIADDLAPSDFPALLRARVAGIATEQGGPTSHVAILARAHGIPALVALGPRLAEIADETMVVLDADRGVLDVAPSMQDLTAAEAEVARRRSLAAEARARACDPATTRDGTRVEIAANVASAADATEAAALGAEAIGLLRTELLFAERQSAPTEAEQCACYQEIVDAMRACQPGNVIIRTLDVGADKTLPYLPLADEENPALGLRGIRLSLSREAVFIEQLRAILGVQPRAAVKILLPMVADVGEVRAVRALIDRLAAESGGEQKIEVGVMIETPAAAVLADQLACEADFFSVGTNDLTQYALCMDRGNAALAARIDGLHPAVLRLVALAAQGAERHGRWLGVCGALASDPLAVPLLLGLGASELSLSPAVIPEIKAVVRRLSLADCRDAARQAVDLPSAAAVREYVKKNWPWLDGAAG